MFYIFTTLEDFAWRSLIDTTHYSAVIKFFKLQVMILGYKLSGLIKFAYIQYCW